MSYHIFNKDEIGQCYSGEVKSFDSYIGLGEIELEDGRILDFHCINIADGTRFIEVGSKTTFDLYFHHRGRFEAKNIKTRKD